MRSVPTPLGQKNAGFGNALGPRLACGVAVPFLRTTSPWLVAIFAAILVMCLGGRAANAMVCQDEEAELEEGPTSVLAEYQAPMLSALPPPPRLDAPEKRELVERCDSFSDTDCDMGLPEGTPSPAERFETHRTGAALLPGEPPIVHGPNARALRQWHLLSANSSEYLDEVDRPPQRS